MTITTINTKYGKMEIHNVMADFHEQWEDAIDIYINGVYMGCFLGYYDATNKSASEIENLLENFNLINKTNMKNTFYNYSNDAARVATNRIKNIIIDGTKAMSLHNMLIVHKELLTEDDYAKLESMQIGEKLNINNMSITRVNY